MSPRSTTVRPQHALTIRPTSLLSPYEGGLYEVVRHHPVRVRPDYDLDVFKVLFLDGTHSVPPWKPMNGWLWAEHCTHGLEWACQTLKLPTLKGLSFRLHQRWRLHRHLPDRRRGRDRRARRAVPPEPGPLPRGLRRALGACGRRDAGPLRPPQGDQPRHVHRSRAAQELRRHLRRLQAPVGAALPLHVRGLRGVHALRVGLQGLARPRRHQARVPQAHERLRQQDLPDRPRDVAVLEAGHRAGSRLDHPRAPIPTTTSRS